MNKKNKFFIIILIFIVLFTLSVVSANENITEKIADDASKDVISEDIIIDSDNLYNDVNLVEENSDLDQIEVSIDKYKKSYNYGDTVKIKTTVNGAAFKNKDIDVYLERKNGEVLPYWGTTNSNGVFNFKLDISFPGSYKVWGYVDGDKEYSINNIIKINKIPVKIYTNKCTGSTSSTTLKATVKYNGKLINFGYVKFKINGKSYTAPIVNGMAKKNIKLPNAKTYTYNVYPYKDITGKASSSKVVVKQSIAKVTAKKCKTNVVKYATLKATIKKGKSKPIDEGSVKFKINGKTYKVKVKNGVAVKKIKLSKKNTYTYKARFVSKYYKSKVSNSKIVVNNVMFKKGKYVFGLTAKQYKKLKYAKEHRHGKRIYLRIIAKTNQHYNYKKPIYSTKYIQKSKWVYKYKLASESWWGEWGSEWEDYYPKTPSGYTWCGSVYKNGDGWSKTYYKYKKKVTYTDSEEVIVGYTTKRLPVYACISSRFTHASFDPLNVIELRFYVNPLTDDAQSLRMPIYL